MIARGAFLLACLLLVCPLLWACGQIDEDVQETAVNVLTLQSGTISELKDLRGTGPFRDYALPPEELLTVVEEAARKARGEGDTPVRAIFVSERSGEVVAKERAGDDADYEGYDKPFRSAMVATVHPILGEGERSKLEIHAMHRGPFRRGHVQWERDMPRWIDEVLAARANPQSRIRPIK